MTAPPGTSSSSTTLRVATLALLLFCLFRPVLVVKAAVSQQNFLAVLVDDSRSMQIADWNGKPRADFIRQEFVDPASAVSKALSDRFVVRTFRFSSAANRIGAPADLTFGGSQTRLGTALDGARQELAGLPLAGVVLVSDGADTTDASLSDALLNLKAASVPVFTVGIGAGSSVREDIQVSRINVPAHGVEGHLAAGRRRHHADRICRRDGLARRRRRRPDRRLAGSAAAGRRRACRGARALHRRRIPGSRRIRFRIAPRPGELVTQNNAREALIDVRDRREKILYFEGEPRFEYKFIRRAVADDSNLQVVGLQRTADNKYYRQELDNADQLVAGFPRTRDELFAYRGLILGSIEAGAFTGDQLRMIADFVERRGGGLLVLGGGRSFAEGSYAGTPVADVLPVVLERPQKAVGPPGRRALKVRSDPRRRGARGHAARGERAGVGGPMGLDARV